MSEREATHEDRTRFYARFLRAGGSVPLRQWLRLAAADRDALEAAGEQVAGERAELVARALAPPAADPLLVAAESALRGDR